MTQDAEKVRVITHAQYVEGYLVRTGVRVETRAWRLIRKLDDGNYLVRHPEHSDGSACAEKDQ